jgi:hypothetical protein
VAAACHTTRFAFHWATWTPRPQPRGANRGAPRVLIWSARALALTTGAIATCCARRRTSGWTRRDFTRLGTVHDNHSWQKRCRGDMIPLRRDAFLWYTRCHWVYGTVFNWVRRTLRCLMVMLSLTPITNVADRSACSHRLHLSTRYFKKNVKKLSFYIAVESFVRKSGKMVSCAKLKGSL